MTKKISIVTICFNAEQTIKKTFESINNQTYQNIEHIVIDGSSTDNTLQIINQNKLFPGKIISEKDSGTENAMNKGLKYASGDIIAFLHADDFFSNKYVVDKVMNLFKNNIQIVYGNIEYFDHNKNMLTGRKFISGEYKKNSYLKGWHAPNTALFISKYCYEKYGNYREDIKVSSDFELMFRFQELNKLPSNYLNETLTYMGANGISGRFKNIIIGNINIIKALLEHKQKFFIPLFLFRRIFPKILDKVYLIFSRKFI